MTSALTGEEGREAGKKKESEHGKWRRDRPISGPKWDNHRSLLFRQPLLCFPCSSFHNSEAKFTKTAADGSEKLRPNYCNKMCDTSSTVDVFLLTVDLNG